MSLPTIDTELRYRRTDQAEWSVGADGRITVKDVSSGWFFPLNDVATLVWDMLDGANTTEQIVLAVREEFEIDVATVQRDVRDFIEQARDLNLIA